MTERLKRLHELATRIHADDRDLQGRPYIEHVRAVTSNVSDQAKPIALLHDALEDHGTRYFTTIERELTTIEFTALLLLTRRPGDTYHDYIERIATWPGTVGELAREVKLADLRHNLGRLTPRLARLSPRYENAIARLMA